MKHKLLHLQSLVAVALCVIMAMAFTSCSDDDDEPVGNNIVGTWRLSLKEDDGGFWYCQYNFKSNGTLEVKDWSSEQKEPSSYEAKGTYTVSDSFITLKIDDEEEGTYEETYRFSIEGNKLIIFDYEDDGPNVFYKV
ncbi:MAG: hypothetical protein HDS69_05425 [Bacteroidales bacterium]|nr:hypothetical protein [Bacteroidales bacterium]